jgi:hypothetical protein
MTNVEEVIECLGSTIHNAEWANKITTSCDVGFLKEIYAMLKSQEPTTAIVVNNDISGAGSWWYVCGKCKMPIDPMDKFCRHCGKAVNWR